VTAYIWIGLGELLVGHVAANCNHCEVACRASTELPAAEAALLSPFSCTGSFSIMLWRRAVIRWAQRRNARRFGSHPHVLTGPSTRPVFLRLVPSTEFTEFTEFLPELANFVAQRWQERRTGLLKRQIKVDPNVDLPSRCK
jgi:hypothetical protein